MAKNRNKNSKKSIKAERLLEEAKTMTIQQLADKYGVCYQTMHSYLKDLEFEARKGRPKSVIID